jgi:riboflavin kinase / FMN adenylyltransferase
VEFIRYTDQLRSDKHSVVTVGTFDGVHTGHKAVLRYLIGAARKRGGQSTLVTFDPHPRVVVREATIPLLTTIEERARLCDAWGLDRFIVIPFTSEFAGVSAEDFVRKILLGRIGMTDIVVGHDHSFGKGGKGNTELLLQLAHKNDFHVDSIPAHIMAASAVSSSRIRSLIEVAGDLPSANSLLGYEYGFDAVVVRGSARGREIGFPTANLERLNPDKIIPLKGVYAVRVDIVGRNGPFFGMMNIGTRPTFGESDLTMEVNIIDADLTDELYDRQLRVEFVERLRGEQKFEGIDALVAQLKMDRARCRDLFAG